MAYYSSYWRANYSKLPTGNVEHGFGPSIDTDFVRQRQLRYGGYYARKSGDQAREIWVAPDGMVYHIEDLYKGNTPSQTANSTPAVTTPPWQQYAAGGGGATDYSGYGSGYGGGYAPTASRNIVTDYSAALGQSAAYGYGAGNVLQAPTGGAAYVANKNAALSSLKPGISPIADGDGGGGGEPAKPKHYNDKQPTEAKDDPLPTLPEDMPHPPPGMIHVRVYNEKGELIKEYNRPKTNEDPPNQYGEVRLPPRKKKAAGGNSGKEDSGTQGGQAEGEDARDRPVHIVKYDKDGNLKKDKYRKRTMFDATDLDTVLVWHDPASDKEDEEDEEESDYEWERAEDKKIHTRRVGFPYEGEKLGKFRPIRDHWEHEVHGSKKDKEWKWKPTNNVVRPTIAPVHTYGFTIPYINPLNLDQTLENTYAYSNLQYQEFEVEIDDINANEFMRFKNAFLKNPGKITSNFWAKYYLNDNDKSGGLSVFDRINIKIILGLKGAVSVKSVTADDDSFQTMFQPLKGHPEAGYIVFTGRYIKRENGKGTVSFKIFNATRQALTTQLNGAADNPFGEFVSRWIQEDQWQVVLSQVGDFFRRPASRATEKVTVYSWDPIENKPGKFIKRVVRNILLIVRGKQNVKAKHNAKFKVKEPPKFKIQKGRYNASKRKFY